MGRILLALLALAAGPFAGGVLAETTSTQVVCRLIGEGSANDPVFGTDLGIPVMHRGDLVLLFGDTTFGAPPPSASERDDSMAVVRLPQDPEDCLDADFVRSSEGVSRIALLEGGVPLSLGMLRTPVTGFSAGERMYAIFARGEAVACEPGAGRACPGSLVCEEEMGACLLSDLGGAKPAMFCRDWSDCRSQGWPLPCVHGAGLCLDPGSSQRPNDPLAVALQQPIAVTRDPEHPAVFATRKIWPTNRFSNVTAVTIDRFDEQRPLENDYGSEDPQHLLLFGRPGFLARSPGRADLYLLHHDLSPLAEGGEAFAWRPRYFEGLDAKGAPRWGDEETRAAPVISEESVEFVAQHSVHYIDPIRKWIMFYAGAPANVPMIFGRLESKDHGAIQMRTADLPWGPWSEAQPVFDPEHEIGYGAGGLLFRRDCPESGSPDCAVSDWTHADASLGRWLRGLILREEDDRGVLYAPYMLDAFTRPDGPDAAIVYWIVSTWNPYRVALMRTRIAR